METTRSRGRVSWVVAGGLLAGTLDILYAIVFWAVKADVAAARILQSVAAGLLGPASFEGGVGTAALGLALHYCIALSMSAAWYAVARRVPALRRRPVLLGGAYGLLLYGIMNYVVLPLSAAGPRATDPLWTGLSIAVHVFLIGIPIALFGRRALRVAMKTEAFTPGRAPRAERVGEPRSSRRS